jgi:DnaJ-class molecular chaperone
MFGAGGGRRAQTFEQEDFGAAAPGRDVTGTVTITLPEVLTGASRRVQLPTGKEIDAKIPAGLADGQTIRLKGQGLPGPGGPAGDALITVTIAEHPLFKRDGANLRLELPVTLYEAVLGGKVRVPTLDGAVQLAIPPGTSSGRTLRVKGKGPAVKGRRRRSLCDGAHRAPRGRRRRARGADEEVGAMASPTIRAAT